VPQEIALYQDLSAEENLTAFGRFHGLRGMELKQRVEWALVLTGLEEQRKVRVQCFSGGMKRRVNIACGVLHRPSVLLLGRTYRWGGSSESSANFRDVISVA
jgi:ABC-2 type transport system ATP-binding protein